jgi:hypothetical protein
MCLLTLHSLAHLQKGLLYRFTFLLFTSSLKGKKTDFKVPLLRLLKIGFQFTFCMCADVHPLLLASCLVVIKVGSQYRSNGATPLVGLQSHAPRVGIDTRATPLYEVDISRKLFAG